MQVNKAMTIETSKVHSLSSHIRIVNSIECQVFNSWSSKSMVIGFVAESLELMLVSLSSMMLIWDGGLT